MYTVFGTYGRLGERDTPWVCAKIYWNLLLCLSLWCDEGNLQIQGWKCRVNPINYFLSTMKHE